MTVHRIRTLLVANRGEIARRVFRTARAMGICTVAVFADADADSPHAREADQAVRLPGVTAAETYLQADLLLAAAERTGADAIHPGYGFLSENADFARRVGEAGLVFVGPSPEVIAAMGSKIEARERMRAAGVPVLPGAPLGPGVDVATTASEIGFPLLVKASAGGGGRGMRIVSDPGDLAAAVTSARREAGAAFGDDTVFLERYVVDPRHVEVQIFGDQFGTVVSLFERECSIQRRFQKIVEEAPSPAVSPQLRERLGAAAVLAGQTLGYVGAGTVEFILDPTGAFSFLEVNTRLQVEHPITEAITGLDLVRLQLLLAAGEPLPAEASDPQMTGHAIEARLYAEDPARDFLPTSGRLRAFEVPPTVRTDAGVVAGQEIGTHYDALLAKVIAYAPTRDEAAATLTAALRSSRLHGVRTNRDLLVGVVSHPEFLAGHTDTGFLARHPPAELASSSPELTTDAAAAAVLALRARRRGGARVQATVTPGWRNVGSGDPLVELRDADGGTLDVRYRVSGDQVELRVADRTACYRVGDPEPAPAGYLVPLERDGVLVHFTVAVAGPHLDVSSALGSAEFNVVDPLPPPGALADVGSLVAPMPGTVLRTDVAAGDAVVSGQPLLVLEAMKMEHTVRAPHDGVVTAVAVAPGDQVTNGQQLVVLDGATP